MEPVRPPIEPMLAKLADELPPEGGVLYEPKWDGFRALVFKNGKSLFLQSRDSRPLDRYFPDLHDALLARVPKSCVLDGEIVIATSNGLDFDALQLRLHPAASRVAKLAAATPASFVAFDLLAVGRENLMGRPQADRRARLEQLLAEADPPLYLTPVTRDRGIALDAMRNHPWREWAGAAAESRRMPGAQSRWSAGKDLSWEPLRPERVCEVKYDHLQGDRFRHAATFLRWRPDKPPESCRYDQLETTPPYELADVFSSGSSGP